jgi:thiol-disulfide isomerase/thioredoxin
MAVDKKFIMPTLAQECEPVKKAIDDLRELAGEYGLRVRAIKVTQAPGKDGGPKKWTASKLMEYVWMPIKIKLHCENKKYVSGQDGVVNDKRVLRLYAHGEELMNLDARWDTLDPEAREKLQGRWKIKDRAAAEKFAKRWNHNLAVAKQIIDDPRPMQRMVAHLKAIIGKKKGGNPKAPAR